MKHKILIMSYILLCSGYMPIAAQKYQIDSTFHEELLLGLDHVANSRHKQALDLFEHLEKLYPDHPAPNFFKAATYQSWMLNYRISAFQDILFENTKFAIEKGEKMLENNTDPWLNFYVGAAYGFNALHRFRQYEWISSYFDAINGIDNFEIALQKEPHLYDCYYGLGSYNYWRSAKSKFIRFLIFWMEDKQDLGLQQLKLSVDKGSYCRYEATHGLIIAYYHNGDYFKALKQNEIAMTYIDPPALSTLYMRGRLMVTFGNWQQAEDIFQIILNRLLEQPYLSISYQAECKYWMALALKNQMEFEKAFELVADALEQSKNWEKRKELENPFESFAVIIERLTELHDELEKKRYKNIEDTIVVH